MKVSRHAKIIELITQHDIETQEELAEYLEDAGFKVTQATVSRDIRDLKLTKMSVDGGRQKYVILKPEEGMSEKYIRVLQDGYASMDMAQNILVVKTVSGMAMAVAAAIDAMKWNEVVGCIAGDDTIMCAIRSAEDTAAVMENIQKIVTKGKQWIRCNKELELLDTPGILWPKFEDQRVGLNLAMIGSINDEILHLDELAYELVRFLCDEYPGLLEQRYNIEISENQDAYETIKAVCVSKKCLLKGEELDIMKASSMVVDDFRNGRLGKITLEAPK